MATRSPFLTPRPFNTFANFCTSRCSCWYVNTRISPGSLSQMIAALFFLQVVTCRSRQLYERLISPPTNHFAHGQFHSNTLSHFLNQCSSFATRDQNASGFSTDSLYIRSYSSRLLTCACRLNSGGHSNFRCSCRMESMLVDWGLMTALSTMMKNLNAEDLFVPEKRARIRRSSFYTGKPRRD